MSAATPELRPQATGAAISLPAACYVEGSWQERERQTVFAPAWHLVGHASQLSQPGAHLHVDIAGVPVIVLRDAQGELRALHNVCRHRAGPLALCGGDGARLRLRCRYHGWSYGLDGQLLSAPEMQDAVGFDPATIRLPAAQVQVWRGLVFVNLDVAAVTPPLADLDARLDRRSLAAFRFHRRVGYEIACNWKVYVDNYLEGYHIPHIHPDLNRMLDYRSYTTETGAYWSLQHSPLENTGQVYGQGEALYVFLWPNAMLNLLPDRLQLNRVLPLAPDHCRVEFDYLYPDGDAEAIAAAHACDHDFSDLVQTEDVTICEAVQRGLASGSYRAGPLNPLRESGVHHFQDLLRAAYRAGD